MIRNVLFGHIALSIFAAGSNYLFQVVLARFLGQADFTTFSGLWAEINFLMFIGTWSYYAAAIYPLTEKRFKQIVYLCHILALSSIFVFSFIQVRSFLSIAIILGSIAHSMLSGRLIGEGKYLYSGIINLTVAVLKILLLIIFSNSLKDYSFIFGILYVSFLFTHVSFILFCSKSLSSKPRENLSMPHTLMGALILTLATHFFPSADVLWVNYFRPSDIMKDMAPLSLVTRGIFFAQIIWAQWWLPKMNDDKSYSPFLNKSILIFSLAFLPILCALAVRTFLQLALNWDYFPDLKLFYFAALNATFMALHFQRLQFVILKARVLRGALMLTLVVSTWVVLGLINSLGITHYFLITIISHALACLLTLRLKS